MTSYRFTAQALTPIHVGCGCEIEPTEFLLHENRLVHFNPAQVLNDLPMEELNRYLQLLDRADLKAMQTFLKTHFDPGRHGIAHVDASKTFRSEFELKARRPDNQFRVDLMPRNPHSGQVYLPGSGIKGAIRTAVVNYYANLDTNTRDPVHKAVKDTHNIREKGKTLEEAALNRPQRQTEKDIFRLIDLEDVHLPLSSTRIDRAANFNPQKPGAEKIAIWVERIKSRCDGVNQAPSFPVTLHLDTQVMNHKLVRPHLGRTLDLDLILDACNKFFWKRMLAEGDKFDGKLTSGAGWKALYDLFPKGKTPDGEIVVIEPSKPYWCTDKRKRMLLRMGRFSHFESLSVDELRQGFNIQAKRPISDMGSTRIRCLMEDEGPPMPFGWLLLTLDV
jgi:CRISPR-associated protein Csm5